MKNFKSYISESSKASTECYIVDLETKKVVETGTREEINDMFFSKKYNLRGDDKKIRYICVTADELKNGNFYIKPNEITK